MTHALNHCVICGKLKERHVAPGKVECWPRYYLRKTCGRLCGAALILRVKNMSNTLAQRKCGFCMEPLRRRKDTLGRCSEALQRFRDRFYCNQKCFVSARRSGLTEDAKTPTAERSKMLRAARLVCDMSMCERCGVRIHLHVHHVNRDWRDNRPENLECLCVRCHTEEHRPDLMIRAQSCAVSDCEEEHHALGFCLKHYAAFRRHGDALGFVGKGGRTKRPWAQCAQCDDAATKRGFCGRHYAHWRRSPAFFPVQLHQKALSMSASEKPSIFKSVEMDAMYASRCPPVPS